VRNIGFYIVSPIGKVLLNINPAFGDGPFVSVPCTLPCTLTHIPESFTMLNEKKGSWFAAG
jgi:hypothetical protein